MFKWIPPDLRTKFKRFFGLKKARVALILFGVFYIVSLFADFIANDKPLLLVYNDKMYFPIIKFYAGKEFGQQDSIAPDYKVLSKEIKDKEIKQAGDSGKNRIIFPILPYGKNESLWSHGASHPSPPTLKNWFGTDDRGRDVFTRLLYGFRISVHFALVLVMGSMLVGSIIGAVQGYFGKGVDLVMQRLIEIFSAMPFLYVVILIGVLLGRNLWLLLFAFLLFNWISISYYMRAEYLKYRSYPFVESAKALGQGWFAIVFKQILPNALTPIVTFFPFEFIGAIFSLTALDYLGFGLPAPTPSWGEMLSQGISNINAWWLVLFSTGVLFASLLMVAFIGEGIREAFDPKSLNKIR